MKRHDVRNQCQDYPPYCLYDRRNSLGTFRRDAAGRLVSMTASGGNGYEFEGLFASVIGGTALSGGEGGVGGAIIGAFIVATLRNGLTLMVSIRFGSR